MQLINETLAIRSYTTTGGKADIVLGDMLFGHNSDLTPEQGARQDEYFLEIATLIAARLGYVVTMAETAPGEANG